MRYSGSDISYMPSTFKLLIYISIHLPYVLGHGVVDKVVVAGQTYEGWHPFTDPYVVFPDSPFWDSNELLTGITMLRQGSFVK
jgi:hypothetical protein